MTTLLPWQVEEIEAYAAKGKSGGWIARKLDLKSATVNYRMLRAGFDPWPGKAMGGRPRRAFSAEEDTRLLELGQTMNIDELAKELKRPRTSVRIRLMTLEVRAEKALERSA